MCHVQSLEKDIYLGALGSFNHDFTHMWWKGLGATFWFWTIKNNEKHLPNLWHGNFMHFDDTMLMWTITNAHVGGMYKNTSFQLWLCWHNSLGFLQAKSRQSGSFQLLESSSHFKGVGCTFWLFQSCSFFNLIWKLWFSLHGWFELLNLFPIYLSSLMFLIHECNL
jgi:hypothetical protein